MQSDEAAVAPRPGVSTRRAGGLVDAQTCGPPVVLRKRVDTAVPVQGSMVTRAREGASGTPSQVKGGRPCGLALGRGILLWSRRVPPGEWPLGGERCPGESPRELLSARVLCVIDHNRS